MVIPAHEGWPTLTGTLASLREQDRPPEEIIIALDRTVDWGPVPEAVRLHEPPVIPVSAPAWAGPAGGRNIGLSAATGDVIVFLDSSVVASPGLITEHLAGYTDADVAGVAGPTRFVDNGEETAWFYRFCPFLYPFGMAAEPGELTWSPTANLSYHRAAMPQVTFDERFPVAGACEDVNFCFAIRAHGRIEARPAGRVDHELWHPLPMVIRKFYRWGRGEAIMTHKAMTEPGIAPLHARRFNDLHALALLLLAVLFAVLVEWPQLGAVATIAFGLRLAWRAGSSLRKRGLSSWRSQVAAWIQVNAYLCGVFREAFRLREARIFWRSAQLFTSTAKPRAFQRPE